MGSQIDEKGKFFTQVVTKVAVPVTIQMGEQLIHGSVHVRPGARILDELNNQEKFLAVTHATVCNLQDEVLYRTEFLVVNLAHIAWILPDDERKPN